MLYLTFLYILCGLPMVVLGTIVLKSNYKSLVNQAFFSFTASTVLWIVSLYVGIYYLFTNNSLTIYFFRLAFFFVSIIVTSLTLFFYSYPRITFQLPKFIHYILIICAITLISISATPYVFESTIIENGIYIGDKFGILYLAYTVICQGFLLFIFYLIYRKIQTTHGNEKKRVYISGIGFSIFWILATSTNLVLPIFDIYIFQNEAVSFSLFFVIPTFYSIYRHRFFNIPNIALNYIRNIIIVAIFLISIFLLNQISYSISYDISPVITQFISPLVSLFIIWKIINIFPKFIDPGFREFYSALKEFQSNAYYCKNYKELENLLEKIFIIRLNISQAKLFIIRDKKISIKEEISIYIKDKLVTYLQKNKTKILIRDINKEYYPYLKKLDADILIPLYSEKNLIGLFVIGSKPNDKPYSKEESDEIVKIKNTIEITFMNVLLTHNLQVENNLMKKIVEQKTKNLKEQNREIRQLLRQQQDFMAVTAHEFRTPLSIALFQLEDTMGSYHHRSEVTEDMKVVEESLNNLKNLTQKLFDTQQYDLDKVEIVSEEISISEFIKKIYEDFQSIMHEKSINFIFENNLKKDMTLNIDLAQMKQVFHNLLTNAFKFTPIEGNILLKIIDAKKHIIIFVEDSGKGIPDEDKKRVLEKFQTVSISMGMGIGLGLYLCKKILDLHQGEISVEDSSLGGAKICVTLPK